MILKPRPSITRGTLTARYVFDGNGRRVLAVVGDTRTVDVNEYFDVNLENGAKVNQDLTIENIHICENRYCIFIRLALSDIEAIGKKIGDFGTTTFITESMEPDNSNVTWRIYYPAGGLRVQTTTGDVLSYLCKITQFDLTSLNTSGSITEEMVYLAFGETRYSFGATPTDWLSTGI